MGTKKNDYTNYVGLDRYASKSRVPFDTVNDWFNKGLFAAGDKIMKLHGDKLYGRFVYNGVHFKIEYSRKSVNISRSKISEKKRDKYQAKFNESHERHH